MTEAADASSGTVDVRVDGGAGGDAVAPGAGGAPNPANPGGAGAAGGGGDRGAGSASTLGGDKVAQPVDWPDDWREKMAAGDEKVLQRLSRFKSPLDVSKSFLEAEKKIRSTQVREPLPDNPTPEQLSTWRKDNGVPETPGGYDLELGGGLVIGEADKPLVDKYLQSMHKTNAPPAAVKAALSTYYQMQQEALVAREQADKVAQNASRDELRKEWGNTDFTVNFNLLNNMLDQQPEVKELLENARLADGTPFGFSTPIMKWLVGQMREINPIATVVPSGGGDRVASAQAEMDNLKKEMGTVSWTPEKRDRFAALVDAMEKTKARAA